MKLRPLLVLALLFTGCLARGAADYEIRLYRGSAKGIRYQIVATGMEEQSMSAQLAGQEPQVTNDRLSVELTAECEVLATTPKGKEAQTRFVIGKFLRTDPDQKAELLPPETVVVAQYVDGETHYTIDGKPVAPLVARALEMGGMSMDSDDEISDDAVFAPSGRKKVGDSWPINAAMAAADLAADGIPAMAENLTGAASLEELTTLNGEPVLRITMTMSMHDVAPPMPPGFVVRKSDFRASESGLYPVDLAKPKRQSKMTMTLETAGTGMKDGKTMEVTGSMKSVREAKFTRH